jgi:hypothetical protein
MRLKEKEAAAYVFAGLLSNLDSDAIMHWLQWSDENEVPYFSDAILDLLILESPEQDSDMHPVCAILYALYTLCETDPKIWLLEFVAEVLPGAVESLMTSEDATISAAACAIRKLFGDQTIVADEE